MFRSVMRELIAATAGFVLVAEAASSEVALANVRNVAADFVIVDARLSDTDGVQTAVALLDQHPGLVVLLVSVYELTGPPPVGPTGLRIPFVCKGDLRTSVLRSVWDERKPALAH